MEWFDRHIEWIGGLIIAALVSVVTFFTRIAWNDRKGVMTRLDNIETKQETHTGKILTLEQEVREAEVQSADDRQEIIRLLEKHYSERQADSSILHERITGIFGGLKEIQGELKGMKQQGRN